MAIVADEIARLTEANRLRRSRGVEARLLQLRLEHARARGTSQSGPLPPIPSVDLFAGTTGLPEIPGSELTAHHVASGILYHGALLVRGLVPLHRLAVLRDAAERTEAERPVPISALGERGERTVAAMMCSPTTLFDVMETYHAIGVREIVEEYLGEPPVLLAERVWVRRHRAGRGLPWHQDAAFFGGEFRALNIWLAVTACGDDAPGLSVVARRFSRVQGLGDDEIPAPLHYGLAFSAEDIRRFAGNYEVANPRFEPGDALLFDEMTLHRTSPVAWRVPYKDAAVTWFFAPSRFPPHRTPLAF